MKFVEFTKVVDWHNTRNDKKIIINVNHILNFEEIPNGNGCTVIRYPNGTEIHVRESYDDVWGNL
jgi:uncharacterized protein YlzI (FlbEa/FlbD family)